MKVQVSREQFLDIRDGLNNSIIATQSWDPDEGMLFIECEEDIIVADVFECMPQSQGRFLIIFNPLLPKNGSVHTPISGALEEVREPQRPKRSNREILKSLTKPWHGYYVE